MYKLIIADDERRIRQGLKNIVDWESLGFQIVDVFEDGQEVIEYLEYMIPDVILTDIKMAHVSGLKVARHVFEHKLPCKVVLISGYQEFELALEAMKYGVEDYLLKPTDVMKIEETFRKIRQRLDKMYEERRKVRDERERIAEALPLLEESFFSNLVMGVADNDEYVKSCMGILYPHIDPERCRCLLADIYIKDYENFMENVWEYSYDQFEVNLTNFLRIYQNGYSFHIVYKADNLIEVMGIYVGYPGEEQDGMETERREEISGQKAMEQLLSELETSFRFHAGYLIRQTCENIFQIKNLGGAKIFWEKEENREALYQHLQEQKKLVMSNITLGNIVTAQKVFHNILEELKVLPMPQRNNTVIDMLSTMHTVLGEINGKLSESLNAYFDYRAVLSMTRQEELTDYMDRMFDRIKAADEKQEYYDTSTLISKAKAYIKDHIYKDISQEETANYLYISPSYLSRIFRKQTGENFLQYVTRVKMEEAIELLKDPQYKTYQVSEKLGYKTPRYFSRLFRNHTGMNPSEYRGRVLHIGGDFDED